MAWAISIRIRGYAVLTNPELLQRVSGLERSNKPTGLFAASRPSLGRLEWVEVFRRHLWIFAARRLACAGLGRGALSSRLLRPVELCKALFQFPLFRSNFFRKDFCQLLVKEPKFLKIHGFEILPAHNALVTVGAIPCPSCHPPHIEYRCLEWTN